MWSYGFDKPCAIVVARNYAEVGPMQLTAVLMHADEGGFVALNPETGTTTQGEPVDEAVDNLREATTLCLEEFALTLHEAPLVTTFTVPQSA